MQEAAKVEREQKESGTSWRSLRTAARLTPGTEPSATSCGVSTSVGLQPKRGCEQHVLVHTPGKVIWHEHKWRVSMQIFIEKIAVISGQQMLRCTLSFALCWRRSLQKDTDGQSKRTIPWRFYRAKQLMQIARYVPSTLIEQENRKGSMEFSTRSFRAENMGFVLVVVACINRLLP